MATLSPSSSRAVVFLGGATCPGRVLQSSAGALSSRAPDAFPSLDALRGRGASAANGAPLNPLVQKGGAPLVMPLGALEQAWGAARFASRQDAERPRQRRPFDCGGHERAPVHVGCSPFTSGTIALAASAVTQTNAGNLR